MQIETASTGAADVGLEEDAVEACEFADLVATAVVHLDVGDGANAVLLTDRRVPIDDVDLAKNQVGIFIDALFQHRSDVLAGPAPVGVEIDDGDLAGHAVFLDIGLFTAADDFNLGTGGSGVGRWSGGLRARRRRRFFRDRLGAERDPGDFRQRDPGGLPLVVFEIQCPASIKPDLASEWFLPGQFNGGQDDAPREIDRGDGVGWYYHRRGIGGLLIKMPAGHDIKRNIHNYIQHTDDQAPLTLYLGCDQWKALPSNKPAAFCRGLFEIYRRQLSKLGYNFVGHYQRVTTAKNVPLYYLLFASKQQLGEKFWNETLRRVNEPELF